jgi:hypothetical protein
MIAGILQAYGLDYRSDENVPSVICKDWREFTALIESLNRLADAQYIFRGQRRADWELTPGLARFAEKSGASPIRGVVVQEQAELQLSLFRKALRGRVSDHALLQSDDGSEDDELWSIGQHYGLNTPLLDWTQSPYVALFFAFEKEDRTGDPDNPYRVVYALDKAKAEALKDKDGEDALIFIEPRKDDHGRLVSQAGLFTRSPYGKTLENALLDALALLPEMQGATQDEDPGLVASYVFKILVANEGQSEILRCLRQMNIHPASLFPDLMGAASNCNKLLEERYAPQPQNVALTAESIFATPELGRPALSATPSPTLSREWTIKTEPELLRSLLAHGRRGDDYLSLSREIMAELAPHLAQVDWQYRDSAVAKMRNVAKVVLRKNGYPEEGRDRIAQDLLTEVIHDRGSA